MLYADVVFNLKIEKQFTYTIPLDLSSNIFVGQRVLAPFGRRELTGVIVGLTDKVPSYKCKAIIDVLDEKPLVSSEMLQLTKWMADYYMTGWGQVLQLVLPKGIEKKSNITVELLPSEVINDIELSENQRHLYDSIIREPGKTTSYYRRKVGLRSFSYNLRKLESKQLVILRKELSGERVRKKITRFITVTDLNPDNFSGLPNKEELLAKLVPFSGKPLSLDEFKSSTEISAARIKTLHLRKIVTISEKQAYKDIYFSLS